MVNNLLWHAELGELDIRKPDLGRPALPGLWELLLADKRTPLSRRQLQCGGICRRQGYVEWMYVYERQGKRVAAHEAKTAERRHVSNESPEHQAYKERTVRVATEAGHRAEAEVRTKDGKVRSDVVIYGATDMPTGLEIQRSFEPEGAIRRRNKASFDHGVLAAWHTDDTQMFNRNEVAWTRTDNNLPREPYGTAPISRSEAAIATSRWRSATSGAPALASPRELASAASGTRSRPCGRSPTTTSSAEWRPEKLCRPGSRSSEPPSTSGPRQSSSSGMRTPSAAPPDPLAPGPQACRWHFRK
ncbi:hypothetical protein KEF29_03510 [Streptomyces tuirus]|uniref:Uncharacterized protein n=1 Tax=Streptomyces tuirus TaxID=68278 RepID=A0A941F9W0_9ACTN|nr:hypothetical protein [Streptomyces tuirus]